MGRSRRSRARRAAVGGVATLLLLVIGYYVGLLVYVDNAVERSDVLRLSGPEIISQERQLDAENFLLVGSDGGDRDTTILAHLSHDGRQAVVVVFPGGAYVDVPSCEDADGQPTEPYSGPFNTVYEIGGAGCLVRTVQVLTGLRINHYVQMDIAAFPAMVDAVGGVPMCLGSPVRDQTGALDLPMGSSVISGQQTLPLLRLETQRGSAETDRIERQQQFLAAMVDRSLAPRTVFNPVRLTQFVTAAARSLTLDPDTSLGDLRNLIELLGDLTSESVVLLTAPISDPDFTPAGSSSSYLLLDEQRGQQLYQSIIEDTAVAAPAGAPDAAEASAAAERSCS